MREVSREKALKRAETFDYDDILPAYVPGRTDSSKRLAQSVDFVVMPAAKVFNPKTGEVAGQIILDKSTH